MPASPIRRRVRAVIATAVIAAAVIATAVITTVIAAASRAPLFAGEPPDPPPPVEPETALDRRAGDVARAVQKDPAWPEEIFDASFRANVPADTLRKLLARTFADEGAVRSVRPVRRASPLSGRFEFLCAKGGAVQLDLTLADAPGDPIRHLRTYGSVPGWDSLDAAAKAFGQLGAGASLCVREMDSDRPPLASANASAPLDVASCFKLWVLGALVDEIREGRRRWTETVVLDRKLRSIPTGILHRWPDGSPVTLHTLASLMIEKSDNTATDHLIALLGRPRVERAMRDMGCSQPERNLPLLTTAEMFKLKYLDGGKHGAVWTTLDEPARRALLSEVLAKVPVSDIDSPSDRTPRWIGAVGWTASAEDLCRAMEWIVRRTSEGPASDARAILAIESGTTDPPDVCAWQGFKGGRLPGVASRAWAVRTADGRMFSVAAIWNDPARDVDEARLARMGTRVLQLLER